MDSNIDVFLACVNKGGIGDLKFLIKASQKLKEYNPIVMGNHPFLDDYKNEFENCRFNPGIRKKGFAVGFSYLPSPTLEMFLKENYPRRHIMITCSDHGYEIKRKTQNNKIEIYQDFQVGTMPIDKVYQVGPFLDDRLNKPKSRTATAKGLRDYFSSSLFPKVKKEAWQDLKDRYLVLKYGSVLGGVPEGMSPTEFLLEAAQEQDRKVLILDIVEEKFFNRAKIFQRYLDENGYNGKVFNFTGENRRGEPDVYTNVTDEKVVLFALPNIPGGLMLDLTANSDFIINSGANTLFETVQAKRPFFNYVYSGVNDIILRPLGLALEELGHEKSVELLLSFAILGNDAPKEKKNVWKKYLWDKSVQEGVVAAVQDVMNHIPAGLRDGRDFVREMVDMANEHYEKGTEEVCRLIQEKYESRLK